MEQKMYQFCTQLIMVSLVYSYYDLIQNKITLLNCCVFNLFTICVVCVYLFNLKSIHDEDKSEDDVKIDEKEE